MLGIEGSFYIISARKSRLSSSARTAKNCSALHPGCDRPAQSNAALISSVSCAVRSAAVIRQLHTIKNRSVGYDHVRFPFCSLWSPVVSEGAQATSVFADEALPIESPSAPMCSVASSACCDVLQRLQIPNFDV